MSVTIEMFSKLNQTLEDDVKIHILHMRSSIYFYIKTGLVIFFIVAICDEIQMKLQKISQFKLIFGVCLIIANYFWKQSINHYNG